MQIHSSDELAGLPILRIRKLLRQLAALPCAQGLDYIAEMLDVSEPEAEPVIRDLEAMGYLNAEAHPRGPFWTTAGGKGMALAFASAAQPIRRASAERTLAAFLERVREMNRDPYYLMRVRKVVLFGSFLDPARERLSDIDLAIRLEPRALTWDAHLASCRDRVSEQRALGRWFGNLGEEMCWASTEALLMLKARKRSLSINLIERKGMEDWLSARPHRVIFQARFKARWPLRSD